MICFDITNLGSFRNVDNWLEEVKRCCPEQTPVFLVGTKSDLESKRVVSYSTIKTYIEQKNLTYIETSSKTNENIENCFLNFTKTLVAHTNQAKISHASQETQKIQVDLTGKTKPVTNPGWMGGYTCTI